MARSQTQNNANTGAASKTIQLGDLKVNRLTSDLTSPGFLMFYQRSVCPESCIFFTPAYRSDGLLHICFLKNT